MAPPSAPTAEIGVDAADPTADEQLMMAAKHGDTGAFTALARRYTPRLVAYCMQFTRHQQVAEDAAQDIWLGIWAGRTSYEPTSRFVALLFTAARNRCRNLHRGKVRALTALGHPNDADLDSLEGNIPTGLDRMVASEQRRRLSVHVDALSPTLREVLVLRIVDELSYADIAVVLGVPEATARSRARLAVQKLRELAREESP